MIQRAERIAIWRAVAWWLAIAAVVVFLSSVLVLTVHDEASTMACFIDRCEATSGDSMAVLVLSRIGAALAVVAGLAAVAARVLQHARQRRSH